MSKISIMTDSNSGITQEEAKALGIKVLPMPFLINGQTYFENISLTQKNFIKGWSRILIYLLPSHRQKQC